MLNRLAQARDDDDDDDDGNGGETFTSILWTEATKSHTRTLSNKEISTQLENFHYQQ